jgi:hypothetical protein
MIFFTGILHLFLLRHRHVDRSDAGFRLTMIVVKKMPAAFRQPASFTHGASAASVYAAL